MRPESSSGGVGPDSGWNKLKKNVVLEHWQTLVSGKYSPQ